MSKGFVYLIGAGPGDPELITLKAVNAIAESDVVIYDYLANPSFLDGFKGEIIYVGKKGSDHTIPQEDINKLIIKKALEGKTIARLKGGDPFIFGRGGEEALELVEEGIGFSIVPGISSFYSAPAYAGIPITHRDFANAIEVITGHRRAEVDGEDVNFPEYNSDKTFAFLMGVKNLDHISKILIEDKNFPEDIPVALISWGTRPNQRVATGPLKGIAQIVKDEKITSPAIILVGHVVSLREKLRWFDNQPLFGKKIVVTRTRKQASKLSSQLSRLGAEIIEFPTIEIKEKDDLSLLEKAIKALKEYNWIVFTSQNALEIFFNKLSSMGYDSRALGNLKIAAIGSATGDDLKNYGLNPDIVPVKFIAESLLESFSKEDLNSKKILLPCSEDARYTLAEGLNKMGASVDRIHTYSAVIPKDISKEKIEDIKSADIVTFTSSSTANNFFEIINKTDSILASIGPVTSKAIKENSRTPQIEADEFTVKGLVTAIKTYFQEN